MLAPKEVRTGSFPLPGSNEIAQDADFWMAARADFARATLKSGTPAPALTAGVMGISMAMRLREGLDLDLVLHTKDAAVADKLLADADREIQRVLNLEPAVPFPIDLLKGLKAAKTTHGVSMKLSIKPSDIPAPLMDQLRSALSSLREVLPKARIQQKSKPTIHVL